LSTGPERLPQKRSSGSSPPRGATRRMLMFLAQSQATVQRLADDLVAAEGGRSGEAAELALLSAEAAPVDGAQAQALSRAAVAASASAAGEHQEAERLVREAVGLIPERQGAEHASSEAARLYTLKGNIVSAEQVPLLRRSRSPRWPPRDAGGR
jgi:hypothetical protein